jgi:tRNA(His) guanylyltransferase
MMLEKGVNWNDLPSKYKRGTYVRRREVTEPFTVDELDKLPPKHQARLNPELMIKRTIVEVVEFPPMRNIGNRADVIFNNDIPKLHTSDED